MSNSIEEVLEDAYKMGVNDATLKVNDHDVLMPKMKVKAKALITEARQEEHDWLFNKFGDSDVSAREFEIIQHEANYRLKINRGLNNGTNT